MATIGVIPGDGVGPEVIGEALAILEDLGATHNLGLTFQPFDLGSDRYLKSGEVLPDSVLEELSRCDSILLGAIGDPRVPPGVLEKGLLLKIRFAFQQYINLRPVQLMPGVDTPIKGKGPDEIDMVVVRENNEDLYVGAGGFTRKGTPEEVAIQTSINTRAGVERCIRYAFELAKKRAESRVFPGLAASARDAGKRGLVSLVAKTNVLTFAHNLWDRAFNEVARDYPTLATDYHHVDACCMRMVVAPERYDVIVTTNMFGDIITDLGAVLQGGMGVAASGNLNPEGDFPSMFEPVHGSAPDIAGSGKANPIAAILSIGLLLDHLKQPVAASKVRSAIARILADPNGPKTPDLCGTATTSEVGRAIREAIAQG